MSIVRYARNVIYAELMVHMYIREIQAAGMFRVMKNSLDVPMESSVHEYVESAHSMEHVHVYLPTLLLLPYRALQSPSQFSKAGHSAYLL